MWEILSSEPPCFDALRRCDFVIVAIHRIPSVTRHHRW